jgi:drug/metabolite transporter (DMT)-like permease
MNEKNKQYLFIGMVVSMLLWGLGWPSTKILTGYATPIHVAISRFLFTFTTLFFILIFLKQKLTILKTGIVSLLLASVLMSVYTMFFLTGIQKGTPGAGGVLVTTLTPICTYAISILVSKRKPSRNESFGLLLGFIAACFMLHIWEGAQHILQSGNAFFLLSCITWAVLSRITAKAQSFGSPLTFTFWMYILCFIFLFPFATQIELWSMFKIKEGKFWLNLLYNACINTGLATTFYFFATSKLGASKSSSFLYIVPFAAAFFSWLLLNETFHWNTIVGGIFGITAVYVFNAKR